MIISVISITITINSIDDGINEPYMNYHVKGVEVFMSIYYLLIIIIIIIMMIMINFRSMLCHVFLVCSKCCHIFARISSKLCQTLDSLRESSVKIGTIQRRLAWPLRKDDTHKSRSVNKLSCQFITC